MSRKMCVLLCSAALLCALILNGSAVYFTQCAGDYVQVRDSAGNSFFERRDMIKASEELLSRYEFEDYPAAAEQLSREQEELRQYLVACNIKNGDKSEFMTAVRYSDGSVSDWAEEVSGLYNLTPEQTEQRIELLSYCISRLDYARGYPHYVNNVVSNSGNISSVSIFGGGYSRKNALKTRRDFYGAERIQLSAESGIGIMQLFSDSLTDVFAAAAAVASALIAGMYIRRRRVYPRRISGELLTGGALVCGGAALLYLCNVLLIGSFTGLGDLSRPVQSVDTFLSCNHIMSVGGLIMLRTAFKLAACGAVYFAVLGLTASGRKLVSAAVIFGFAAVEVILLNGSSEVGGTANFFRAFSSEQVTAVYGNINIFGSSVSGGVLLAVFSAAVLCVSAVFACRRVSAYALEIREAEEKKYYGEITEKYDEMRKIRHDINNHLSALAVLLDDGKVPEARKYLGEISKEIYGQRLPVYTGRNVLDALLFGKTSLAAAEGIAIEFAFYAPLNENISDYSLCGIFGNILDNAIEACRAVDGERRIRLTVKRQMDMLCIFCENPFAGEIDTDEPETVKTDKSMHGFGLKRIRQIAAKYGGTVEIDVKDNIFAISVILSIN